MKPNLNILHSNSETVKLLVNNRNYLGHITNKWNPKMKPFLRQQNVTLFVGKKRKAYSHVLDPLKTLSHIHYLSACLSKAVAKHKKLLFVGTKGQYKGIIARTAYLCNSYYMTEKWLGGFLTNWQTVNTLIILLRKYDLLIAEGILDGMYKKEAARAYKERNRLYRLLEGVKFMMQKPDLVVVMGQLNEATVLDECKKLHIPSICLVDSNCSPRISNLVLPINDDSTRSLNPFLEVLINGIKRGELLSSNKDQSKDFQLLYTGVDRFPRRKYKKRKKSNIGNRNKNRNRKVYKDKRITTGNQNTNKDTYKQKEKKMITGAQNINKSPNSTRGKAKTTMYSNSNANSQPPLTSKAMSKGDKFNENDNQFLKFSKNKKVKSIESVEKGASVLPNGNVFPEISKPFPLTTLPKDLSVLPKELPTKKLKLQEFNQDESSVKKELNKQSQPQKDSQTDTNLN